MRIIRRKKGKKNYFYLQHSFRAKNKVITRERYLGSIIPKNIEDIKARLIRESRTGLYARLDEIRWNFKKNWQKTPGKIKEKEKNEIAIAFTYNTNAIEGSTITLSEAREILIDKVSPNKPLKDIRETESHYKVFLDMLNTRRKISKQLLLKWHKDIFGETKPEIAGVFRDYRVRVGAYIAPYPKEIKKLMYQLNYFVTKNQRKMNPAEMAARTHYRFEKIHPFGDGNGRIGRLLMNYILWNNAYPMIIIEYKKRKMYYNALAAKEEKFVTYFLKNYLKIHRNWIE
jgi:Fic family protein